MALYVRVFSQLIGVFNQNEFYQLILAHNSERDGKGYNSWDHFVAMLFCQLAQAKILREICGGLACCVGKLRLLRMQGAPKKSTLSYANARKFWQQFRDVFYETLVVCKINRQAQIQVHKQTTHTPPRQYHHPPLLVPVSLGAVPTYQGSGEALSPAGSRWVPPHLRLHLRGKTA